MMIFGSHVAVMEVDEELQKLRSRDKWDTIVMDKHGKKGEPYGQG
jgi:hypothetical protein